MKFRAIFLILLTVFILPLSASAAGPVFPDVSQENWAYHDIERAAELGLMQGLENGHFGPETRLDRAGFLTILSRMLSWPTGSSSIPFTDVPQDAWYFSAVSSAWSAGVLEERDLFRPQAYITRSEMAVLLVRALGYDTLAQDLTDSGFPDVTAFSGHIALAHAIGMTNGIELSGSLYFQPDAFATRGQAASMLVRVYDRYVSKLDFLHGFYAFSSYPQLSYTAQMDAVSVGWARMSWNSSQGPWINDTSAEGNEWTIPQGAPEATAYFQGNNTPYNLNIFADSSKTILLPDGSKTSVVSQVTGTAEHRTAAVVALVSAAQPYAGLTIDFEGLKGEQVKVDFVSFLTELRAALPSEKTLYTCVQPDTWYTGYDYRGIGEACDKVILMAHDYQWTSVDASYLGVVMGGPQTSSPVTPFTGIYEALADITDPVIGVQDKSKIALAISFGSAGFRIDDDGHLLETTIYHPAQDTIAKRLTQADTVSTYDLQHRNPVMNYTTEDGARYLLWYEDTRSVTDKIELARMFGITGVSLWRLGNIPSYTPNYDVWSAVLAEH